MNFDIIIPFGKSCEISCLLQQTKLKKETTLFEWFVTQNLRDIISILKNIVTNTPVSLDLRNCLEANTNYLYMGDIDTIYSSHYSLDEFKSIYDRRKERLLDTIKNNNRILFIRIEHPISEEVNKTTDADIEELQKTLQLINPNISEMKLLLFSIYKYEFTNPFVIYKYMDINLHHHTTNIKPELSTFFLKCIEELGYNINNTNNLYFNDKS